MKTGIRYILITIMAFVLPGALASAQDSTDMMPVTAVSDTVSGTAAPVHGTGDTEQEESVDVDRLQWSVSAAAGITLKLAPHVNLYAEPGIVYYFDDGSHVSTIRKEKPLNINLQAGLRFDF